MKCFVRPDGSLEFIYSDDARALLSEGSASVTRASVVEPRSGPQGIEWTADMATSSGPVLGPFTTREEALRAEVGWLEAEMAGRRHG